LEKKTLTQWVTDNFYADAILVGTVLKVTPTIRKTPDSSCWAKLSVSQWLKGEGAREIWVNSRFNGYGKTLEGIKNLEYCEFKLGETYILYGHHVKNPTNPEPPQWISTASNIGIENYSCTPNTRLYGSRPSELDKKNADKLVRQVRNIIEQKKGK
jgi:hypothetical protein